MTNADAIDDALCCFDDANAHGCIDGSLQSVLPIVGASAVTTANRRQLYGYLK